MYNVDIFTAFSFGFLAFFSACTFPLIPGFIAFILGVNLEYIEDSDFFQKNRKFIFLNLFAYILGSVLMLTLLGAVAGEFSVFLHANLDLLRRIGGVFIIIFGLDILGIIKFKFLAKGYEFSSIKNKIANLDRPNSLLKIFASFLLGIIITFTWIPCLSPILGTIFFLASSSTSSLRGAFLLFIYGLGENLPLIIFGSFLSILFPYFKYIRKNIKVFEYVTGFFTLIIGVSFLLGTYSNVTNFFYPILNFLSYK